ncbi:5-(carboxyamino)imidazole ribonucleotide mutase [Geomonas sp. Red32]|uniref:5-(carboxyamino)imidazole ribonucleotide mutase n=1 Tax=Geomonas sp. Red32 TaxID=2912856 RepID=UPI00202CEBCF|nr:5-(carboxyamino)imidazole ribonucleotide mutase [Geomonas sp. Red32]MCM0084032.1 5-(carboxyamino)imidazole ribonucleotide mutase [Geomonas sp. Red32]
MSNAAVLIMMGSDSDLPVMEETAKVLDDFGVPFEMRISSAHRCPERTAKLASEAAGRGIQVIIAAAGMAAHLAGVVAAETTLPVIGVPMPGGALNGVDALYSTVQMPGGIPVASMAIGKAGAKNAGLFAVQILALSNPALRTQLASYKAQMVDEVEQKDQALQLKLNSK